MNFPIIDTILKQFEKYYDNGYLGYAVIGLVLLGLYAIIRVIGQ